MKILGIGGGLQSPSRSLTALKIAGEAVAKAGAEFVLLDINKLDLPLFRPNQPLELYPTAPEIQSFLAEVAAADGYLFSAPTYHGSISGAFKNAIDFLELLPRKPRKYLAGKVVGLIAVGGGASAAPNSLTALFHITKALRAVAAPSSVAISQARKLFDAAGNLEDSGYLSQLEELGAEVVNLTRALQKS
jgi:FMN reductase